MNTFTKGNKSGVKESAGSLGFSQNQVSASFQNLCFPLLVFLLMLLVLFFPDVDMAVSKLTLLAHSFRELFSSDCPEVSAFLCVACS